MVKTMQKMQRSNQKIRRWMEERDFKNIKFFHHTRFSKDLHIDELDFDGIATYQNHLVLFQAKTNLKASKKLLLQYRQFSLKYNCLAIYFNVVDREGVYASCNL